MRRLIALLLLAGCARVRPAEHMPQHEPPRFAMRVISEGLAGPWEVFVGPDGWLWVSERNALRVTRIDPRSGTREVLLTIEPSPDCYLLGAAYSEGTLFVSHTYLASPGVRRTQIVSYSYDPSLHRFHSPHVLLAGLSADGDHAAGRVLIGPDRRVYYTLGDQGKNQYANKCKPNRAQALPTADEVARQDWSNYEGKVLRLERDGSIPRDNPVLAGVRSHVYSYGHRNPQGLAFDDHGRLYASEHGPKSDDEINLIRPGKNYGWPHVAGFRDGRAYEYANWSSAPDCEALAYDDYVIPAQVPRQPEQAWDHPDFAPPLHTLFTVDDGFPFAARDCGQGPLNCWPTIAPSSLAFYTPGATGIASWGRALLVPSLKRGSVFVLRLTDQGALRDEPAQELLATHNRYRDLAVGPDRRTIYVVTDNDGVSSGPSQHSTQELAQRGALLEFKLVD
jgi:PQQ-dependent dehydrogenase (s-GDH family)